MTGAVVPARTPADLADAGELIREFIAGLGLDLSFQGFEAEVADLSAAYAAPAGALFLLRDGAGPALGCVGVKPFRARPGACEMKRLYLREGARGTGAGRALALAAVEAGRALGYREMLLDTLGTMAPAVGLYRALGFEAVPAYYHNPIPGVVYFRLAL